MEKMLSFNMDSLDTPQRQKYLQGAIGPRPIALASTLDTEGNPNLSPFSFFNVFSSNPPILIFSPARRVRDNTTKHTLENVLDTGEVAINIVNHAMVEQMSLSSTEYPQGTNEFVKAGFTMVPSQHIAPFRVGESPVQLECKVTKVEALGDQGGAGNLIFSEVVALHIKSEVLDSKGEIDPHKIDQVARMGGNWYSRANAGLFTIPKPIQRMGIGVDALPLHIRTSTILTGNDLGRLGNLEALPTVEAIDEYLASRPELGQNNMENCHREAQKILHEGHTLEALIHLMAACNN